MRMLVGVITVNVARRQSYGNNVRKDVHAAEEDSVLFWPVWAEGWSGRFWPER
jgi:hypothetical protein